LGCKATTTTTSTTTGRTDAAACCLFSWDAHGTGDSLWDRVRRVWAGGGGGACGLAGWRWRFWRHRQPVLSNVAGTCLCPRLSLHTRHTRHVGTGRIGLRGRDRFVAYTRATPLIALTSPQASATPPAPGAPPCLPGAPDTKVLRGNRCAPKPGALSALVDLTPKYLILALQQLLRPGCTRGAPRPRTRVSVLFYAKAREAQTRDGPREWPRAQESVT
jgi:hypothetical protein